jgi:hypothetical protein
MDESLAMGQNVFAATEEGARALIKGRLITPTEAVSNVMARGDDTRSADMATYMQSAIEQVGQSQNLKTLQNAEMQRQIAEGIKNGITRTMSDEVKKGILEAWHKEYRGAKYSN